MKITKTTAWKWIEFFDSRNRSCCLASCYCWRCRCSVWARCFLHSLALTHYAHSLTVCMCMCVCAIRRHTHTHTTWAHLVFHKKFFFVVVVFASTAVLLLVLLCTSAFSIRVAIVCCLSLYRRAYTIQHRSVSRQSREYSTENRVWAFSSNCPSFVRSFSICSYCARYTVPLALCVDWGFGYWKVVLHVLSSAGIKQYISWYNFLFRSVLFQTIVSVHILFLVGKENILNFRCSHLSKYRKK